MKREMLEKEIERGKEEERERTKERKRYRGEINWDEERDARERERT